MQNIEVKLDFWKNRLLDLGKRNRLINCPLPKDGKRVQRHTLLINSPPPNDIWRFIADGDDTLSFPVPLSEPSEQEETEFELSLFVSDVQTNQSPRETYKTLRSLQKKAREFTEEKGLNALHLAFGFLNWIDNVSEGQEMRSPLLLVPVKLTQEDLFSPIVLSRSDEEISANFSLIHKLHNDFGIELPVFTEETALGSYLNDVAQAVKSLGWSVSSDATQLSLFSFMKINMYKDLERNSHKICGHSIIRAINGEAIGNNTQVSDITEYRHDEVEPQNVLSVVDADSSQQDAILLAKRGASFVLQGPPGTGKSQTITNIIAELIADGKKVLFVSEKMAALEVVYKRLTQAGLAQFCLTLHSHKAKRREILDQFGASMKMSRQKVNLQQDAFTRLHRLQEVRAALNRYTAELHTVIEPLGKTIYQVCGYLSQHENFRNIDFVQVGAENFTPSLLSQCESALEELTRIVRESGYQQGNPWAGCTLAQTPTFEFRQRFIIDADKLLATIADGISVTTMTNDILGINCDWSYDSIGEVSQIYSAAEESPGIPSAWLSLDIEKAIVALKRCAEANELTKEILELSATIANAEEAVNAERQTQQAIFQKWETAHTQLLELNDESILQIDAAALLGSYRNEYRTWLRGFISGFRQSQKLLLSHRKTANRFSYEDGLALLDKVVIVQNLRAALEKQFEAVKCAEDLLEEMLNRRLGAQESLDSLGYEALKNDLEMRLGVDVDPPKHNELISKLEWAFAFQSICKKHNIGNGFADKVCAADGNVFRRMRENNAALNEWRSIAKDILNRFILLFVEERRERFLSMPLRELVDLVNACKGGFSSLEYLIDYRTAEKRIADLGISAYLLTAKEIELDADEIIPVYRKCFFRSWLDAVIPRYPSIQEFRRLRQDERISLFKELDKSHIEISKAIVVSKLISRLPNFDAFSANGEIALLRREMAKQRKLMPIRLLIAALPNLLPALKPCVLMSPLSVSTYLGNSTFEFDTVIFDEASQVRTEDAIGAIFRAKQVIIAGDSKQLPPSDFFMSSISVSDDYEEDGDGEINDIGAYESLLDEATMLPTQTLLWHYRSRHEHLIAFSNAKIYQGNLTTFPSSVEKTDGMGVEYIHVPGGTYDRGGKNGNKAEATKVAELVFEHFHAYPDRSIGIIAFGEVQQSAIQDALIEKRRLNPSFEPFFKEDREESLFIKNLETVQGDERDTILFSIGYAPDASGKFVMNFGPLSRTGGERRLNVAVTRARYNLKLIGSIAPTDIDPERVSGQGPKLLRLYIDFAINGAKAILGEVSAENGGWFDSPFEASVYDFLTTNGYDVATQVGCSGYRIDMAVRHPNYPGRFAIGIECDGAMYHSARTARERDRLRQTVLEDMGWKIFRIWSTDWIKDRHTEGTYLLEAVQRAIDDYREIVSLPKSTSVKMTDFLDVRTQSPYESAQKGIQQKINKLRSPYYGLQAKDISSRDMSATMLRVLANDFGLDKVGLFKETALYGYGWERQGSKIKEKFETAFRWLLHRGAIAEDANGKLYVVEGEEGQ